MLSLRPLLIAAVFATLPACPDNGTTTPAPAPDVSADVTGDAGADTTPDASAPDGTAPDATVEDTGPDIPLDIPPPPDAVAQVPTPWSVASWEEGSAASCDNGIDDDDNGYTDCNDRNCTDHPYVWLCGTLENGPDTCSDGIDNAEAPLGGFPEPDGLIDCDDPDCSKNPYLGDVCPSAPPEGYGSGSCGDLQDNDGDGKVDCDDLDCLLAPKSPCGKGGRVRVLFDGSHGQYAGGADWLVDTAVPFPRPSNPDLETDWAGKYSFLGLTLVKRNTFVTASLPRGKTLTWNDDGLYDLSRFDVLVLPEPSSAYSNAERDAIAAFVQAGGGLMMIANHEGADRDNNDVDAVKALNDMLISWSTGGLTQNPLGFWFELVDYNAAQELDAQANEVAAFVNADGHPVLSGPGGTVDSLGMYVGTTIGSAANGAATPLVWPLNPTDPTTGAIALASEWGAGRIIAMADSAIFSDRTDSHGVAGGAIALNHQDNLEFAINAFYWLGKL